MSDYYTHFNDFGKMKSYPKPEIMPKDVKRLFKHCDHTYYIYVRYSLVNQPIYFIYSMKMKTTLMKFIVENELQMHHQYFISSMILIMKINFMVMTP